MYYIICVSALELGGLGHFPPRYPSFGDAITVLLFLLSMKFVYIRMLFWLPIFYGNFKPL